MNFRIGAAGTALLLLSGGVFSQVPDEQTSTAALLEKLERQEQRLKVLERKLELQEEAEQKARASAPVVNASATRFSLQSADKQNSIRLRGVLHFDGRRFTDDIAPETADTWLLRRARPIVEGTVAGIYDFRFTPDFGNGRTVIQDAYVAARLKPWAVITAGKFKVPIGLERIQSANDIRFIERAFPTSLVPNRDLGVQLGGALAGGAVTYNFGYFNGVNDGSSSESNPTPDAESDGAGDIAGRIFLQPFLNSDRFALRGLGFGLGATWVDVAGSPASPRLPSYRTPGQQTFFSYRSAVAASGTTPAVNGTFANGERLRWSPQFHYYLNNFGVLGEYVTVSQDVTRVSSLGVPRSDTLDHRAWQLQLSWALTGEEESFRSLTPSTPFEMGKPGRGAWELVARIHELRIDDDAFNGGADSFANPLTAARRARAVGVGVNWYLSPAFKWMIDYERTEFDGGAATGDRPDEQVVLTRFSLGF